MEQGGAVAWDCHKDKLVEICSTKSDHVVAVVKEPCERKHVVKEKCSIFTSFNDSHLKINQ